MAVVIGVPSGIVAAAHRGSIWDRALMLGSLLGVCVPGFWLSLNFIYLFAVRLGWLPAAGYASVFADPVGALRYMVLPARLARLQPVGPDRAHQPLLHARGAPAGLHPHRAGQGAARSASVTYVHAFRNALVPVVTVIGITTAVLIGGAVVTEIVFNIPGLGRLVISAILRRDYPVVQGVVLVTAAAYVLINLRGGHALRLHRPAHPL